ncbi:hypothetical protein HDU85_003929 [Gaertneriomyces sp. JEL0708]|nr:hypothetical protein HDU85_003929 [Gaertneriomyces sp. JEL0708]
MDIDSLLAPFSNDLGELHRELEEKYLLPKSHLEGDVLRKCQRLVNPGTDWSRYYYVERAEARLGFHMKRDLISGVLDFWNYEVVSHTPTTSTPQNSTSISRAVSKPADFVRGRASNLPFTPGGLNIPEATSLDDDEFGDLNSLLNGELLDTPPGFERGLVFIDEPNEDERTGISFQDILTSDDVDTLALQLAEPAPLGEEEEAVEEVPPITATIEPDAADRQEIDSLLPAKSALPSKPKRAEPPRKEWAHMVDVNAPFPDFYELVPQLAREFPFELDVFQKRAVYHMERGESVFVAAHTSAGKTVVAEYAVGLCLKHMTRAIYTSPIKALSNQKFRDFRKSFPKTGEEETVGILTGDVQISPSASCLVMTTEILRSMLYRGADCIRDVEWVIFDECHYINDVERGVVWEEVIILLPPHINIILLSATVPNTREFADWVGRTKKKDIYVISTAKRPVPLEHFLYLPQDPKKMFKVVDERRKWLPSGYKEAQEVLAPKREVSKPGQQGRGGANAARGGRGAARGGGGNKPYGSQNSYNAMKGQDKAKSDKTTYTHLTTLLKQKSLLPAIVFSFSKKKCEEYAGSLSNQDFLSGEERSKVMGFVERCLARLKRDDRELPQITRMKEMLSRGVAVHHGGLLPIVKEMVEILFTSSLVRILFATETFAMGVNAPARCVIFSSLRKHDGRSFRDLLPGEYTQMSGRAGRRGLDTTGVVLILCSQASLSMPAIPDQTTLDRILLGSPEKLQSQFRLTYGMILGLMRVEGVKVEEMIRRSFGEAGAEKAKPELQKLLETTSSQLTQIPQLECPYCVGSLMDYYHASARIVDLQHELRDMILDSPHGRVLGPGKVVIVNNIAYRNCVAVLREGFKGGQKNVEVDLLVGDTEAIGVVPATWLSVPVREKAQIKLDRVGWGDVAVITKWSVKVNQKDLVEELYGIGREIQKLGHIPEFDFSKIRSLEFQERRREKDGLIKRMKGMECGKCPDLPVHYAQMHTQQSLQSKVADLALKMSDQNLVLLPDYDKRVEVLKALNFVENGLVGVKGRVACEINTADELILTELILDNTFAAYSPEETVALLSCFVFQEKTQNAPVLTPNLDRGVSQITETAARIAEVQRACGLDILVEDVVGSLRFGLVEVVYEWALGLSFRQIMDLTDVLEGTIVRTIVRLEETCREVQGISRLIGDAELFRKMERARECIKRDIVFSGSLYF